MILRTDPGWHTARLGKLTASNMWKAMDYTKTGQPTAARKKYLRDVVAERMTDIIVPHFVTLAMQWGVDMQASAIEAFEEEAGFVVQPEAFFEHALLSNFGATPDGLIGTNVVLEVKCPETATHIEYLEYREIPLAYQYQMTAQVLCCPRADQGVFVSFDPRIGKSARLLILEYTPTQEMLDKTITGASKFLHEVEQLFDRITCGLT